MPMFNKVLKKDETLDNTIKRLVTKVVTEIKRDDIVSWFLSNLRHKILHFMDEAEGKNDEYGIFDPTRAISSYRSNLTTLVHYLSLPIPEIQNYKYNNKEPYLYVIEKFSDAEEKWRKDRQEWIDITEDLLNDSIDPIIKMDDGWMWLNLKRPYCEDEGDAMGHCGNSAAYRPDDTVLSLRKVKKEGDIYMSRPVATFIYNDGILGEMKGRANTKPHEKYHDMIMKLLMHKTEDGNYLVTGIRGGGHAPEENFDISDLSDQNKKILLTLRPELKSAKYRYDEGELTDEDLEEMVARATARQVQRIVIDDGYMMTINDVYENLEEMDSDRNVSWPRDIASWVSIMTEGSFDMTDGWESNEDINRDLFKDHLIKDYRINQQVQSLLKNTFAVNPQLAVGFDGDDLDAVYDILNENYNIDLDIHFAYMRAVNAGSEKMLYEKFKDDLKGLLFVSDNLDTPIYFNFDMEDDGTISALFNFEHVFDIIREDQDPLDSFEYAAGDMNIEWDYIYDVDYQVLKDHFFELIQYND